VAGEKKNLGAVVLRLGRQILECQRIGGNHVAQCIDKQSLRVTAAEPESLLSKLIERWSSAQPIQPEVERAQ
jgi:hypothetical protein